MKLTTFNPDTLPNQRQPGKPDIGINRKAGIIRFNTSMCEKLKLKQDAMIQFHQDTATPEDWYVEIVKSNGFKLRSKEAYGKGLMMQSCSLAQKIFDSVEFKANSGKVTVGQPIQFEKRQLWPVITAALKN